MEPDFRLGSKEDGFCPRGPAGTPQRAARQKTQTVGAEKKSSLGHLPLGHSQRKPLEIASRAISDLFDDTGFLFSDTRCGGWPISPSNGQVEPCNPFKERRVGHPGSISPSQVSQNRRALEPRMSVCKILHIDGCS